MSYLYRVRADTEPGFDPDRAGATVYYCPVCREELAWLPPMDFIREAPVDLQDVWRERAIEEEAAYHLRTRHRLRFWLWTRTRWKWVIR